MRTPTTPRGRAVLDAARRRDFRISRIAILEIEEQMETAVVDNLRRAIVEAVHDVRVDPTKDPEGYADALLTSMRLASAIGPEEREVAGLAR